MSRCQHSLISQRAVCDHHQAGVEGNIILLKNGLIGDIPFLDISDGSITDEGDALVALCQKCSMIDSIP